MRDKEKRILCYGDSNTWGYIPGTEQCRYLKDKRYTGLLQNLLGSNYIIIEEGLNSRTLISNDNRVGKEGRNGYDYLIPCLDTHDPIDLVILMLGTNELKNVYNKTAEEIGEILEKYFIETILNKKSQFLNTTPQLILICPPLVDENTEYCRNKYEGATEKSKELNKVYQSIGGKYGIQFISNDDLTTGIDGVHLDEDSHKRLAEILKEKIKEIF